MGYAAALEKAWSELEELAKEKVYSVRLLEDTYSVDLKERSVISQSCNTQAKPHYAILILHYLTRRLKDLPPQTGEWISFKQLSGAEGYYPAFKKRVIDVIMRKYQERPEGLLESGERVNAKKTQLADISVVLDVFDCVPILINFWRADEEFDSQANVLFDKTISDIFCTEDVVVLAEILAHRI